MSFVSGLNCVLFHNLLKVCNRINRTDHSIRFLFTLNNEAKNKIKLKLELGLVNETSRSVMNKAFEVNENCHETHQFESQ